MTKMKVSRRERVNQCPFCGSWKIARISFNPGHIGFDWKCLNCNGEWSKARGYKKEYMD